MFYVAELYLSNHVKLWMKINKKPKFRFYKMCRAEDLTKSWSISGEGSKYFTGAYKDFLKPVYSK